MHQNVLHSEVASDLGLHCLPITFNGFPGKNELNISKSNICNDYEHRHPVLTPVCDWKGK